ncbi:hypothetical protein ABC383_20325 [Noviherbaspirillum sp. 1P10PC]|uniref:hypothetical protein n=1 Tax=Noviherbaspirillum sp. 1P10PC TaxID=3132292 RepID=UPI0039A3C58E
MKHVVKLASSHDRREYDVAVRMRVIGFAHQAVSPEVVVAAIRHVPNFHLAGLNEIAFDRSNAGFHKPSVQAYYCQIDRRICFLYLPKPNLFRHILYHEIGHHVFALVISSKVKTLWVNRIALQTPSVSAYGATNPQEDFAEAYAMYLAPDCERSAAAVLKLSFLRELVFSGDPWTLKEKRML